MRKNQLFGIVFGFAYNSTLSLSNSLIMLNLNETKGKK